MTSKKIASTTQQPFKNKFDAWNRPLHTQRGHKPLELVNGEFAQASPHFCSTEKPDLEISADF